MAVKSLKKGIGQKPIPFHFSINQIIKHHCKMIDYVNLEIISKSVAEAIRINPKLKFITELYEETGEVKRQISKYQGLTFYVYPNNKIIISGSIHIYFNSGVHNYNDFSFKNLCETINGLCQTFNFSPKEAYLRSFEFGVNINTSIDPNRFIEMIICYGNKSVNTMTVKGAGKGIECERTNNRVKIYNKSLQYKQKENILRIEDKIIRMRYIKDMNIKCLHDITKPENLLDLGTKLSEMFDNLIIHEPIKIENLTTVKQRFYERCEISNEWERLSRNQRYKKLILYNELIKEHSIYRVKETIANQIVEKWNYLLKKGDEYTGIENLQKGDKYTGSIACIYTPIVNESENLKERVCFSCGRDISMQKKGSRFCSEKLFGKEVKQCRNRASNPKNNRETKIKNSIKKYNNMSVPLFPPFEVYRLNINNYLIHKAGGNKTSSYPVLKPQV
jgi:hypothetical protein